MKFSSAFTRLVRIVAGVPKPSPWHEPEAIAPTPTEALPVGYASVGTFTPKEFKVLSQQLEDAGVQFEIVCDTSAPGVSVDGDATDRATVELCVRKEDIQTAAKIVENRRLADGHIGKRDA